ncbi:MAG: ABC transporter substrate-binding protein [Betaproteobacteria bacterium]|nr:MAG: ABC transporter substrate-binding protein [Betaproteobacteria bacterium]
MDLRSMSRRNFLTSASALGAASLFGMPQSASADPPPEITRVTIADTPALCFAPQFVAEELLKFEGFSEVEYVKVVDDIPTTLAKSADISMFGGPSIIPAIDKGYPISVIGALHEGCWELFAHEPIRSLQDLVGRRIAIRSLGGVEQIWLSSMLAWVGVDPNTEIKWTTTDYWADRTKSYVDGKVDAFLAFPPEPQRLRRQNVGRVIVNTTQDRPWSQYFCCLLGARNEFIERYPVATKRALRAIMKASDLCSENPDWAAQYLVDKGFEDDYEVALEIIKSLSYSRWRTDNPVDTLRFHSLRLRDAGMIRSTPQQIIERGCNFSFLNELRKELKA